MIKIERVINIEYLERAKNMIAYKPEEKKLNELYVKESCDLSQEELELLLQLKKDEQLMIYYQRLVELIPSDLVSEGNVSVSMTEEEEMMYDALLEYIHNNVYEVKILPEVKEYVNMLFDCAKFANLRDVSHLMDAISNIQDEFLRKYASNEWRRIIAARDALRTTSNTSGSSRAKKARHVTGRVPNRIR